jgi:methionyl-tRNA formyltransferase
MRIALLTLEASAAACAVRQFVAEAQDEIVLVGLSDPFGGHRGGFLRQFIGNMRVSGPRFIPYLVANFVVPRVCGILWRMLRWPVGSAQIPLAETCRQRGIDCVVVRDVNGPAWAAAMEKSGADLIVSFHFDQILNGSSIGAAASGGVNVHAGLLPHHRGPVPTLHALLDDTPVFGVTVHRLVPRIDAGPILAQAVIHPSEHPTALTAARLLHHRGVGLLLDVLTGLRQGSTAERVAEPLPYCGFPTAAQLVELSRRGRSAANWSDLVAGARVPV